MSAIERFTPTPTGDLRCESGAEDGGGPDQD